MNKLALKLIHAATLLLASRKEEALKKHPELAEEISYFIARAPKGNQKYLGWQCKVLTSQFLPKEKIASLIELFDKYQANLTQRDIQQYVTRDEVQELLHTLEAIESKRFDTKERYKFSPNSKSSVVYQSKKFIVRFIENKPASAYHGTNTKWCTSMKQELHWESYSMKNSLLFFVEPVRDLRNKVAIEVMRKKQGMTLQFQNAVNEVWTSEQITEYLGSEREEIEEKVLEKAQEVKQTTWSKLSGTFTSLVDLELAFIETLSLPEQEKIYMLELIANKAHISDLLGRALIRESNMGKANEASWILVNLSGNQSISADVLNEMSSSKNIDVLLNVIADARATRATLEKLSKHSNKNVSLEAASRLSEAALKLAKKKKRKGKKVKDRYLFIPWRPNSSGVGPLWTPSNIDFGQRVNKNKILVEPMRDRMR